MPPGHSPSMDIYPIMETTPLVDRTRAHSVTADQRVLRYGSV